MHRDHKIARAKLQKALETTIVVETQWSRFHDAAHPMYLCKPAASNFKEDELPLLLERARHFNGLHSLTGMLLYIEGNFFQVLEGEAETVDAIYTKIMRYPRHTRAP